MSVTWSNYSLAQLRDHSTAVFRQGGGSRPDVLLIEIDGQTAVLKDQGSADKWFALLIGPVLTWRECKALKRLATVGCIPTLLHQPNARSMLMTYHASTQITRLSDNKPVWPEFFDKLNTAIDQVHAAGVAHNDLRNPTNILVTPQGDPILVDLAACFCQGRSWNLVNKWLFNKFIQVDLSAITKLKTKVAPTLITSEDIQPEQIAGGVGMAAKEVGQWIRRVFRKLFTN